MTTDINYKSYLKLDKILTAQTPLSEEPLEMVFIVAHQTSEMWFKVLIQELKGLVDSEKQYYNLDYPRIQLQRITKIFEHLNTLWNIIATMKPEEYENFRGKLGTSSGMQSEQYREIEPLLSQLPKRWYRLNHLIRDVENAFKKWQFSHMKTVERIIGEQKGTGGTSGVQYLKAAVYRRLYENYEWRGW